MRRAVLALAGLAMAACAPEPTQVLLVVSAGELAVPADLDAVRIEAYGEGSPTHLVREYDLTRPANALPLSLTLVPSADTGPVLHVIVTGTRGGVRVDQRTATTEFVSQRASRLEVRLGPQRTEDGGVDGGEPVADAGVPATDAADLTDAGHTPEVPRPTLTTSGYPNTFVRGPESTATIIRDVCPAGSVLVGVDFSIEQNVVNGVHPHCGVPHLAEDGTSIALTPGQTLPWRGNNRTGDAPRSCPTNQVVVGFESRHGLLIDQLALRCAPLALDAANALSIGLITELPPAGNNGGGGNPTTDCGPGTIAAGVQTRSASWLEGFGLVCTYLTAR